MMEVSNRSDLTYSQWLLLSRWRRVAVVSNAVQWRQLKQLKTDKTAIAHG
jgi:hypothetical protein